mgnify:CR=1 FL=1
MKELQERLLKVQEELKAPKSRVNGFAKFNYRNSEDILEAVKPLLAKHGLCITIADQVHEIGEIPYIESTVVISYETERTAVTASAGIDLSKKGNDMGQRFGAASTYARRYALCGLLLIDSSDQDPDSKDNTKTVYKKKLTAAIKNKMLEAVKNGQKDAVVARLVDYEVSEDDIKSIINPQV